MNELVHEYKLKMDQENLKGPDQPDFELDLNKMTQDYQQKTQALKEEQQDAKE